jgi:hypothetical protein
MKKTADYFRQWLCSLILFVCCASFHAASYAIILPDWIPCICMLMIFMPCLWMILDIRQSRPSFDLFLLGNGRLLALLLLFLVYVVICYCIQLARLSDGTGAMMEGHYVLIDKGVPIREIDYQTYRMLRLALAQLYTGFPLAFLSVALYYFTIRRRNTA